MDRTSKPSSILSVIALVVPAHAKGGDPDGTAAVPEFQPILPVERLVARQVVSRKHPAVGLDVGGDARRYIALVEGVRPSAGYRLQRVGQVRLT